MKLLFLGKTKFVFIKRLALTKIGSAYFIFLQQTENNLGNSNLSTNDSAEVLECYLASYFIINK